MKTEDILKIAQLFDEYGIIEMRKAKYNQNTIIIVTDDELIHHTSEGKERTIRCHL